MTEIPNFDSVEQEDVFSSIFSNKLNDYHIFMTSVKERFLPGYSWDSIDGRTLEVIRGMTSTIVYESLEEFYKQFPEREHITNSIFVHRNELVDAVKEAMKDTYLSEDRNSNFPTEMTVLGDK